jgi:tetratricopeptide (TPR) repeat protein
MAPLLLVFLSFAAQSGTPEVDPPDLAKRADLLSKELVVDGRVHGTFGFHKGRGFDEFRMEHAPVEFRLPPRLAYERPPKALVVRARGVLKKVDGQLVFEVANLEILPSDLERLDQGVAGLPRDEARAREAWAAWGEHRAAIYDDETLRARAREILADAFRADSVRPITDPADALALAERARTRHVPDPELGALAHRALRPLLARAVTAAEVEALLPRIEAFFPEAAMAPVEADLSRWKDGYAKDPANTYRRADTASRSALNRQLWADAFQKSLELRARQRPRDALSLGEQARTRLPDRPALSRSLQNQGLEAAVRDVGSLRQAEVEELARRYRDELHEPDKAKDLVRRWLEDQRKNRLSRDDADGRVLLAEQFEAMLGDRATAIALLREAWAIDPQNKDTEKAFRLKGYRLVDGEWQPTAAARAAEPKPAAVPDPATSRPGRDPYVGMTRSEIRNKLGKPDRIARSATQGQVTEQWIYQRQYITFVRRAGELEAQVLSHYTAR